MPFDRLENAFRDASLTQAQRQAIADACALLSAARARIEDLERKIKALSRAPSDADEPASSVLSRPDFNREVARMLAFDERYGTVSSVLYFDMENFEAVRSRHGAEILDAAIRRICDTLTAQVRKSDLVGRLAPDEFGVLLARCGAAAAQKKGEEIASELYKALSDCWGPTLKPQISYGAYTFNDKDQAGNGIKSAAEIMTRLVTQ